MSETRVSIRAEEEREECLEALYRLERAGRPITLKTLRESNDLSGVDVPDTLLELIARGAVVLQSGEICLRRAGRVEGRRIYRRHEIAERVLCFFGLKHERAHAEACRLEHVMALPGERTHDLSADDRLETMFDLFASGALPLVRAETGSSYRVALVCGGHGARRKLEDMGVSRGAEVRLYSRQGRGPVEIGVRGSRLAIGNGIAAKVLVVGNRDAGPGGDVRRACAHRPGPGTRGRFHVHRGRHGRRAGR